MSKTTKNTLSIFISLTLILFSVLTFIPIKIVHAEPEKVTLQLDNATISGNVITFDVEGTNVEATVSGSGYEFVNGKLEITYANLDDVTITLGNTFKSNQMTVKFNDQVATVTGDNEIVLNDIDYTDDSPHVQILLNGSAGPGSSNYDDTSIHEGNGVSTLDFNINGVIDYEAGNGYDYGIGFRINGLQYKADGSKVTTTEDTAYERDEHGNIILNDNNEPIPVKDPEGNPMTEKTSLSITGDTINYDYDEDTNTVDFVFVMAPGTLITNIEINGETIENLPSTAEELINCYVDHTIEIEANGIAKANKYEIEITARYPNSSEEFMGNFLWDYNPQGYTSEEDKILNGTLEFVQAEYDGHTYTTVEEIENLGGVFIWKDAPRKKVYTEEREGCGEAQFPKGTILTVRIIPDAGYQLVNFGINGGVFEPQEEIGTYTFEVDGGPFHLQASIRQVDDVVKTTSEKVSAGAIELGGEEESMSIGTARLDVKDIDLTEEQISNFEEAADGYNIKNFIDISLYNIVYKGTESSSWDTEVKDLDNEATIYLQLEDDVNGEDIVIVHEKHDGTYEIIPTEYFAEYNAIVFKTKSFSNYAIASKATIKNATTANPKTGDNIVKVFALLGVCIVGLLISLFVKKRK